MATSTVQAPFKLSDSVLFQSISVPTISSLAGGAAAPNSGQYEIDIARNGYVPCAIMGFNTGNRNVLPLLLRLNQSDNILYYKVLNVTSNNITTAFTGSVDVMYIKT